MHIYSIYDVKGGGFSPPFVSNNKYTAMRSVQDYFNKENPQVKDLPPVKYPKDFILFEVAGWSLEDGITSVPSKPVSLGTIYEILNINSDE